MNIYKINKLLVSPNGRLNNIILEKTIQYNTTQPQNSTAKESNATSEIESTHRGPTQAASLFVCSKYKEMYGRILKSLIS